MELFKQDKRDIASIVAEKKREAEQNGSTQMKTCGAMREGSFVVAPSATDR